MSKVVDVYGTIRYYNTQNQLHNDEGPAVEFISGVKEWFYRGMRHNSHGPAIIEATGTLYYYLYDKTHRIDGPAIIWSDGDIEYWIEGNPIEIKDYPKAVLEYKLKQLVG